MSAPLFGYEKERPSRIKRGLALFAVRHQMTRDIWRPNLTEALAPLIDRFRRLADELGGLPAMRQASAYSGLSFDPFPFQQDGLTAPEIDIGRREIAQSLVVAVSRGSGLSW